MEVESIQRERLETNGQCGRVKNWSGRCGKKHLRMEKVEDTGSGFDTISSDWRQMGNVEG